MSLPQFIFQFSDYHSLYRLVGIGFNPSSLTPLKTVLVAVVSSLTMVYKSPIMYTLEDGKSFPLTLNI